MYNNVMTLKELRIAKKLNQSDASYICNVPLRTYKRLENDDKYIGSIKYNNCLKLLSDYQDNRDTINNYNIAIIGAGYVGYSLGVVLSKYNNVSLIDISKDRINYINNDKYGLQAYLPSLDLYKDKDYIFICVPTDYDPHTGLLDVNSITNIVKDIRSINKKVTIVVKSTCYIGYIESLDDKHIIYSPEFLREKYALVDMKNPSRIIIGCDNRDNSTIRLGKLLQASTYNRASVLYMSTKEAEAVKLFSNAYLAMRLAFFNELDSYALENSITTSNVINGISLDPRIGDYYNKPSLEGYGGKCLPKDTLTLANQTKGELISSIDRSNNIRKKKNN